MHAQHVTCMHSLIGSKQSQHEAIPGIFVGDSFNKRILLCSLLCLQNVRLQLSLKYPQSKVLHKATRTEAFSLYLRECAQVCWDLCVQSPPMLLDYSSPEFHVDLHTRFYESDMSSNTILLYHWPTLMLPPAVPLSRGLVQT